MWLLPNEVAGLARGKSRSTSRQKAIQEELEKELQYTKEHLQTVIEEMETSQEELKSANEELQSTNEELQSTNEEMVTSKEELQSLNEELTTLNYELQSKNEELSETGDDLKNLLNSTQVATLFLDNNLKIKRFTPYVTKIISLIPGDIGRPITDIVSNLQYDDLAKDANEVLKTLVFKEISGADQRGVVVPDEDRSLSNHREHHRRSCDHLFRHDRLQADGGEHGGSRRVCRGHNPHGSGIACWC